MLACMLTRYKLLAQIIVDEMQIMHMNILRSEAVHTLLGSLAKILPRTLNDYEVQTMYTHILSARFSVHAQIVFICCLLGFEAGFFVALMARSPTKTLRCGTGSKETSGRAR
jgi:hypothetical protein